MIYFRGCVVRDKLNKIEAATIKILDSAKVDYDILEHEGCCGSFLHRTGFEDDSKELMKKTLQDLKGEEILVSCAGCYNAFKNDYKEILGVELDVIHTSQLFADLMQEGKLKIKKTSTKVTYHDPCHLGRHCGEYQAPRDVLERTAHLVCMEKNRDQSRCCGAGGGVKSAFPEVAVKIAQRRINEAKATDADILVTACSFCILNLSSAAESVTNDDGECLEVIDISEVILMGMDHEPD